MSARRKLIWALVAFVVTLTIGMLLGATEARAEAALGVGEVETPAAVTGLRTAKGFISPEVSESPSPALLAIGLLAVFYGGQLLFGLLQRKWRRISADMDALIEATHECPPSGPCAWCVTLLVEDNKTRNIARDERMPLAALIAAAEATALDDDKALAERIDQWGKEVQP